MKRNRVGGIELHEKHTLATEQPGQLTSTNQFTNLDRALQLSDAQDAAEELTQQNENENESNSRRSAEGPDLEISKRQKAIEQRKDGNQYTSNQDRLFAEQDGGMLGGLQDHRSDLIVGERSDDPPPSRQGHQAGVGSDLSVQASLEKDSLSTDPSE